MFKNITGKKANKIKRICKFPFVIILAPFIVIVTFFLTDWEDEKDAKNAKDFIKAFFK